MFKISNMVCNKNTNKFSLYIILLDKIFKKVVINLIQISKAEFLYLFKIGVFKHNQKNKEWAITSKQKKSKRKKYYVNRVIWEELPENHK